MAARGPSLVPAEINPKLLSARSKETSVVFAILAKRLVTCDPQWATSTNPLGVIEQGAVVVDGDRIAFVGPASEALGRFARVHIAANLDGEDIDSPSLVTPGLIDAHTHCPWVGSRDNEYALRMAGAGYEEIAAAGGGIVSSMRAIRQADREAIERTLLGRVRRMARMGVTTIECKSGYGLDLQSERKQLEAVQQVAGCPGTPRLVPTYLALHAIPPEARSDRAAYVKDVENVSVPTIASDKLARFVDAYIDRNAFSVDEAAPVLRKARQLGLGVRMHVGQFADVGGAELAAQLGAASVDHLENVGPSGIEALARASVHAVLMPIASLTLRQTPPPIAALRAAGIRLVVASDSNPGTAPSESLPLAMALAVHTYGLTVAETIAGVTSRAADSLGLGGECGMLRAGHRADIALWDLPHENALVQPWGTPRAVMVFRDGQQIDRA